jgi:hypothetical protein
MSEPITLGVLTISAIMAGAPSAPALPPTRAEMQPADLLRETTVEAMIWPSISPTIQNAKEVVSIERPSLSGIAPGMVRAGAITIVLIGIGTGLAVGRR